ncbi:hypothetical protein ACN26Z_05340 [Verrucosispora sp. WMMD703]|uniref:hypothetical protein n=1 Tax=unclassified Micromonospora TaxID=2617518 RepID=UPI002499FC64|nr:hypothetical protein [Verrucosispora sp. WMMD1129]WFE45104.1 hypothetical protein O7624_12530 [Verrucosispora sp. WMMD1129]
MSERITTATAYSATEWDLLTSLPGRVIVAAAQPGPGRPHRGVAAGLAGLDAVAAGRAFDSDLVRAVVAAIYARHDGPSPPAAQLAELDVLAACRAVVRVLDRHADPADSAAYRQWVQSVAARVCRTASRALPGGPLAPADRRFLDRLGGALALR